MWLNTLILTRYHIVYSTLYKYDKRHVKRNPLFDLSFLATFLVAELIEIGLNCNVQTSTQIKKHHTRIEFATTLTIIKAFQERG